MCYEMNLDTRNRYLTLKSIKKYFFNISLKSNSWLGMGTIPDTKRNKP